MFINIGLVQLFIVHGRIYKDHWLPGYLSTYDLTNGLNFSITNLKYLIGKWHLLSKVINCNPYTYFSYNYVSYYLFSEYFKNILNSKHNLRSQLNTKKIFLAANDVYFIKRVYIESDQWSYFLCKSEFLSTRLTRVCSITRPTSTSRWVLIGYGF